MTIRIFSGDRAVSAVEGDDRGLAYGDGVFETLLVHRGQPIWWREHWQRFEHGARVLGIPVPDQATVRGECDRLLAGAARAVLKIILTRGRGGRGYAPPAEMKPTWILSLHDPPPPAPPEGVALQWCKTRMAIQPMLAGIKHCNRLEQVLARAECSDPGVFDGLVCDSDGRVVSATSANLFARIDGLWLTPALQRCGVAGIARGWLLQQLDRAGEAELTPADVENADAVFLCNAVRGILPVRRLGQRQWPIDADVERIRRQLLQEQPAFSPEET
jgi:4-amino-4-deoxychorismate lyase